MTIETTSTINNAGPSPAPREAHLSAGFFLNQLPIELELANPWTITDDELRELSERPDCSPIGRGYIHGFLMGRAGYDFAPEHRESRFTDPHLETRAMAWGLRDGQALQR